MLKIGNLEIQVPIIQGGMGVGISLSGLASAVANEGGVGVISSAGLGLLYKNLSANFAEASILGLQHELRKARESAGDVRTSAEKQASQLIDEARTEASRIIAAAREAAEQEAGAATQRAKEALRDQVAHLAVAGAEKILRREIDAKVHAELLANLKQELQ